MELMVTLTHLILFGTNSKIYLCKFAQLLLEEPNSRNNANNTLHNSLSKYFLCVMHL